MKGKERHVRTTEEYERVKNEYRSTPVLFSTRQPNSGTVESFLTVIGPCKNPPIIQVVLTTKSESTREEPVATPQPTPYKCSLKDTRVLTFNNPSSSSSSYQRTINSLLYRCDRRGSRMVLSLEQCLPCKLVASHIISNVLKVSMFLSLPPMYQRHRPLILRISS